MSVPVQENFSESVTESRHIDGCCRNYFVELSKSSYLKLLEILCHIQGSK